MNSTNARARFANLGLHFIFLFSLVFPAVLFSGGKDHPLQGTVTALGTSQETTGGGTTNVLTFEHRTYTVKTDARIFVLECPYSMTGLRIGPSECGGKKKIALGDTIHFRLEKKNKAFILIDQGKEQRLRVISEAMNTDANSGSPAPRQP